MTPYLLALCCALTALEMIAAVFAEKNHWPWTIAGVLTFVVLFFVYQQSLSVGSLTVVTIGWIFTSQIAAVLVDRFVFGEVVNRNQFLGIIVILVGVIVMCIPAGQKGVEENGERRLVGEVVPERS